MADDNGAEQTSVGGLPRAADFHFFAALAAPLLDDVQRAAARSNGDSIEQQGRDRRKQGKHHMSGTKQSDVAACLLTIRSASVLSVLCAPSMLELENSCPTVQFVAASLRAPLKG